MAPGYAALSFKQLAIFFLNLDELDEPFDAEVGESLGHRLCQQRRHSPIAVKVQKEMQEPKQRAAFQVRENSSQFMQMLFQHFEHVRQELKA
jgi:hypothetical protein